MVQWLRLHLPMKGVWIWPPFGELESHMPCGQKTKTRNRSSIVTNSMTLENAPHQKNIFLKNHPFFLLLQPLLSIVPASAAYESQSGSFSLEKHKKQKETKSKHSLAPSNLLKTCLHNWISFSLLTLPLNHTCFAMVTACPSCNP